MSREDGRRDNELRHLEVVYERLDRVDGSSKFGFGEFFPTSQKRFW